MHVKWYVARNPNTPKKTLTKLSADEDWYVRYNVADNPSTPIETLTKLSTDKDCNVKRRANWMLRKH